MTEPREPAFDPSRFADSESGELTDPDEFLRQVDALIESGNIDPALKYMADALADADERHQSLFATVLFDTVNRAGTPEAALYHATNLAELREERGEFAQAVVCCEVAARVHEEKGRFDEAAPWMRRLRDNLRRHADQEQFESEEPRALAAGMVWNALEYESQYYLEMAGAGRTKQAQEEITALLKDGPAVPGETHILESTLAFIAVDLKLPTQAMQHVQAAERSAVAVGDYADATIYATRRATYTVDALGYQFAKAAVSAADEHMEKAILSGRDPARIEKAADHLARYKAVFFRRPQ
jgi:hypothetical protein